MKQFLIKFRVLVGMEKFRLVKSLVWHTPTTTSSTYGKVYIHCFESNYGNRKITTETTFPKCDSLYLAKQWSVYHEVAFPWLNGHNVPEICAPETENVKEDNNTTESKQGAGT